MTIPIPPSTSKFTSISGTPDPAWFRFFLNVSNAIGGVAGGDLGGSYPNPSVVKINGVLLGTTTSTSGHILIADGTKWNSEAMSGDATIINTGAITLATVNSNVGTFNNVTLNAKGLATAASNVAYITANQTITLSGDCTGSGSTAITTVVAAINGAALGTTTATSGNLLIGSGTQWVSTAMSGDTTITSGGAVTVGANKITYSKMQQASASTLLGNPTGSTANISEITLGTNLSFSGSVLNATAAASAGRLLNIQVFTTSGNNTYTPSAGVNNALVYLWGGGASGGGSVSGTTTGGAGGGGAFAASFVAVSGAVTISIGAGGTGIAANTASNGNNGTHTTYNSTTIVAAGGTGGTAGAGAAGGAGGAVASCTGTIKIAGSAGGTSNANFTGGAGSAPLNAGPQMGVGQIGVAGLANSGQGTVGGFSVTGSGTGGSGYAIVFEYS